MIQDTGSRAMQTRDFSLDGRAVRYAVLTGDQNVEMIAPSLRDDAVCCSRFTRCNL